MVRLTLNSQFRVTLIASALLCPFALPACQAQDPVPQKTVTAVQSAASLPTLAPYKSRPAEEEIIYFVLPDRFANGDTGNDTGGFGGDALTHGFNPEHKGFYHGGDLKGLTGKLDYLEGLGITAIWLGPIFQNKPVQGGPGQESAGYHGYWITDFTNVDPHLGTREDMKDFVDAAHSRGMKVYMDIITNHTADVISYRECYDPDYTGPDKVEGNCAYRSVADYPYTTRGKLNGAPINPGFKGDEIHHQNDANFNQLTNSNYAYTPYIPEGEEDVKTPAWLNDLSFYHNRGETDFRGEASLYGDFAGLDDLFTEHPRVVSGMIDIFEDWIETYDVDGFRIDTTRHVNPNFWRQFLPAMTAKAKSQGTADFYQFGEVYDPDPGALARFTRVDGFDQVLDFGFQSAVFDVVTGKKTADRMDAFLDADSLYGRGQATARRLPTFLGNHDMGRFSGMMKNENPDMSQSELLARTKLAHGLMMFMRGVPVIYSGDEQGFVSDNNDQLAREDMFASRTAVYNDNDLLGTDATTAQENFDTSHPLYLAIREYSRIRRAHPAFAHGEMLGRLNEKEGRIFAFSRFDPQTRQEYLVVANTGTENRTINVQVDSESRDWASLLGSCSPQSVTTGVVTVNVPALDLIVCQGAQPVSRNLEGPQR